MKVGEEIVRILEAFDLTGSYRAAGELAGCDHHTVRKYVLLRDAGRVVLERPQRARAIDAFSEKIEAWVELSQGKIRADSVIDMDRMFNDAVAFNQDLGQWCVERIGEAPVGFDYGATSWKLPRPVWGTCPLPLMSLTTHGEWAESEIDPDLLPPGVDSVQDSDDFVYKVTAQNVGLGTARNLVMSATLSNANVRFVGEAQLFLSATGDNGDWRAADQTQIVNGLAAGIGTFDPIDVDGVAGDNHVRVVFQARATGEGTGDAVERIARLNERTRTSWERWVG